ncbi:hypothetical protein GCK72_026292 [Caenorhabditis remanei]|uniref:Uncharacterized protein n=1 Tax=Caenorhabditis remanei TaxID=31234 RepID=A0A6A5G4U4_CAERE|nr:hypothetical protein GCK72_026292 [Caenorhabditis remanei]KAF1749823.1 hypothetical protein GCK72_026292 [Caenorhabditis remanei]
MRHKCKIFLGFILLILISCGLMLLFAALTIKYPKELLYLNPYRIAVWARKLGINIDSWKCDTVECLKMWEADDKDDYDEKDVKQFLESNRTTLNPKAPTITWPLELSCIQCIGGKFLKHRELMQNSKRKQKMGWVNDWYETNCFLSNVKMLPCSTTCVTIWILEMENGLRGKFNGVMFDCADELIYHSPDIPGRGDLFSDNAIVFNEEAVYNNIRQGYNITYQFTKSNLVDPKDLVAFLKNITATQVPLEVEAISTGNLIVFYTFAGLGIFSVVFVIVICICGCWRDWRYRVKRRKEDKKLLKECADLEKDVVVMSTLGSNQDADPYGLVINEEIKNIELDTKNNTEDHHPNEKVRNAHHS